MTYSETLDYLYTQLPMYQRQGKAAYKANLNNTLALMELLQHPEQQFKSIHIGGTNGKGSTSHMLASVLQAAGYKVGLYTSPHLLDFRERIRINGKMIPQQRVVDFVTQYKEQFEEIGLSFFEWTVGLCFDFFAQETVDIAIIEVGLGGRLDSTNVIQPELSIITNIGYDHSQFLGNTKPEIATEKAGIIKEKTPVIISETDSATQPVFELTANHKNAKILFADQHISDNQLYPCDLSGKYQTKNQKAVQSAVQILNQKGYSIHQQQLRVGLQNVARNTSLRGRWETLSKRPLIICDTAHNVEGVTETTTQLTQTNYRKLHLVLGFVNDKNVRDVLRLFPSDAHYYFCAPSIPRALPIHELYAIAGSLSLKFDQPGDASVQHAVDTVLQMAHEDDLIYIGGSTFVVADALSRFPQEE